MRVNRQVLALALPAIVSNITTPLLALADTTIVGHIGDAVYIGAIAIGASIFNMLYWLMGFLRMGSGGLTAQAYGAGRDAAASAVLRLGLKVSVIGAGILILASPLVADIVLWFMDADPTTSALARHYFLIVIFGAPAVLSTYTLSGWFIGMQNTRAPMWMAIITNVVNIIVSLVLVFLLKLDITGVALGTVISQWTGAIVGLLIARRKYRDVIKLRAIGVDRLSLSRFFNVNIDIFLRTLCLVTVTMWFTRAGAMHGAITLAANSLLMQLFLLFSYFMDGFAFAGEALAGKYLGAGNRPMLNHTVASIFRWGAIVAAAFTLLYIVAGEGVLDLLTDDKATVDRAVDFLPWAIAIPFVGLSAFVWDGIFIGMTRTRAMLLSMVGAMAAFFAGYALLTPTLGNHGLWIAFLVYLLARGVILFFAFDRDRRRYS